jgi:hypothetical protein
MGLLDGLFGPQQPAQPGMGGGLLGTMDTGLQNNSNSLIGMGMGLMSGNRSTAWQNALQGYMMGSMTDYKRAQDRKDESEKAKTKEAIIRTAQALKTKYPEYGEIFDAAGNNADLLTNALRTVQEESRAKREDSRWSASHELDRKRVGLAEGAAERAANQPREVGGALVAPQPDGSYREVYRAPAQNDMAAAIRTREQEAARLGLKQDSPGYQSYVLTGKMPREDAQPLTATDKEAILEADDAVSAAGASLTSIAEAKKLYDKTNTGWFAGTRASLSNNLPDWAVPNFVSSPESGEATVNYENIILGQTLSNLKATFGSAPTEGERAILRDLEASVSKPPAVRKEILDRAERVLQTRLKFNEDRAKGLRGGDYYKPPTATSAAADEARGLGPVTGGAPTRNPPGTGPRLLPPDPYEAEARRRGLIP